MYTITRPEAQGDRITLFPSPDCARAMAGAGKPILRVAVRHDERCRRVSPLWTDPVLFDPSWTAPAELCADGSVIARGPIPEPLFIPCPPRWGGGSLIPSDRTAIAVHPQRRDTVRSRTIEIEGLKAHARAAPVRERSRQEEWSCYTYRLGVHELSLFDHHPSSRAIAAVQQGPAEFALVEEGPVLLLCYRFGEAAPWGAAPYSRPDGPRDELEPPLPGSPNEARALLHVTLIDAEDGSPRAMRNLTLSLDFTRTLHEAIREQARYVFDPREQKRVLDSLRRRHPTAEALVLHALVRSIGSC